VALVLCWVLSVPAVDDPLVSRARDCFCVVPVVAIPVPPEVPAHNCEIRAPFRRRIASFPGNICAADTSQSIKAAFVLGEFGSHMAINSISDTVAAADDQT